MTVGIYLSMVPRLALGTGLHGFWVAVALRLWLIWDIYASVHKLSNICDIWFALGGKLRYSRICLVQLLPCRDADRVIWQVSWCFAQVCFGWAEGIFLSLQSPSQPPQFFYTLLVWFLCVCVCFGCVYTFSFCSFSVTSIHNLTQVPWENISPLKCKATFYERWDLLVFSFCILSFLGIYKCTSKAEVMALTHFYSEGSACFQNSFQHKHMQMNGCIGGWILHYYDSEHLEMLHFFPKCHFHIFSKLQESWMILS